MGMTQANIAVGVFHDPAQAHQALEDLRQAGYSEEEIGHVVRADGDVAGMRERPRPASPLAQLKEALRAESLAPPSRSSSQALAWPSLAASSWQRSAAPPLAQRLEALLRR